jgi:hypothetical protein
VSDTAPNTARQLTAEVELFRAVLNQAAKMPEFQRTAMMPIHLRDNFEFGYVSHEELFQRVYGPRGAAAFWEVECSEPVTLFRFARVLATTAPRGAARHELTELALKDAIRNAAVSGEDCFVGDPAPLRRAATVRDLADTGNLRVDVRKAAEWLLDKPKRRHLVPASLAAFLHPPAKHATSRPEQSEVNAWFRQYFTAAAEANRPPPKRDEDAFPSCKAALPNVTERQMKIAMKQTELEGMKRTRGRRDR